MRNYFFLSLSAVAYASESNPPNFPASVKVFTAATSPDEISSAVNAAFAENGGDPNTSCNNGEFSDSRFAFLFAPGSYSTDVPVGYYTSVYGAGASPYDVTFTGDRGVYCEEACGLFESGSLTTFWRSAENFHTTSSYVWPTGTGMTWAVSQAAPLRNVVIDNTVLFYEYIPPYEAAGYASGGWGSGLSVGGTVEFGSQQQFIVRNSELIGDVGVPVWNGVFVGNSNAPTDQCGMDVGDQQQPNISVEPSTPIVAEKPFITTDETASTFNLVIPAVKKDVSGLPYTKDGQEGAQVVPFDNVYVTALEDTAEVINGKLSAGLHVVISPGIYELEDSIKITVDNQVVLGLGIATLISPQNGNPAVIVASGVKNARVAGVLLQAGEWTTSDLLLVDDDGSNEVEFLDDASPTVLTDVFVRVGGPNPTNNVGPVTNMINIKASNVIIDNTWLWRADHSQSGLVFDEANPVDVGLTVSGDNVVAYGLAVEHTNKDNVVWSGENGQVYFFQAEILYDYTGDHWDHSCYVVDEEVKTHTGVGLGCYTFFRDANVTVASGFTTPASEGVLIKKAMSRFLNGGGELDNVVNKDGLKVDGVTMTQYACVVADE